MRTNSISEDNMQVAFPGNFLILQTIAFCSGSYFARPKEFLILALEVFFGTGILITTCVANNFSEKLAITLRLIEHLMKGEIKRGERRTSTDKIHLQLAISLTLFALLPGQQGLIGMEGSHYH